MANSPIKVVTGKVRFSYVNLAEARKANEQAEAKFSLVIIIPKSDTTTVQAIKEAQQRALRERADVFGGTPPRVWKNTLKDGDDPEVTDLERNPEYEGCYYMNVSAKTRPPIVDADLAPILDPAEVRSGDYGRVSMNAFAYNVSGNKGVSFGLNSVQVLAEGERLGSVSRPEVDFATPVADATRAFI